MIVTGTIDTFACLTALSLPSCIPDIIESTILANIGAGIAGIKKETSTVTRDELNSKIKDMRE
jgi:bifunctional ADP-heptose synthase (sugar kinase/adenylyltransferase)